MTHPRGVWVSDDLVVGQTVIQHIMFDTGCWSISAPRPLIERRCTTTRVSRMQPVLTRRSVGTRVSTRVSRLISMYVPGERAILEKIVLKYRRPTYIGQQ